MYLKYFDDDEEIGLIESKQIDEIKLIKENEYIENGWYIAGYREDGAYFHLTEWISKLQAKQRLLELQVMLNGNIDD